MQKTYIDGLNDAWELAKKIFKYDHKQNEEIFGYLGIGYILNNLEPQEALAKLEAYEKEQEEIKVGDVLKSRLNGTKCVVSSDKGLDGYTLTFSDGSGSLMSLTYIKNNYIKTGKHIDISSILEQIGGGE